MTDTDADFREGGYRFDDLKRARIVSSRSIFTTSSANTAFRNPSNSAMVFGPARYF